MTDRKFSTLNLLDLPRNEREVFLRLARYGPSDATSIAEALGREVADIQDVLTKLSQQGHVRQGGDRYEVVLGPVTARTSLPGYLWSAFLTTDRLYSEHEIAALRTAVPMLQFARARLTEFTDHGPGHAFRVKALATQLGHILDLTSEEHHLLRAGALFHDVGNVVDRARHNLISQETVEKLAGAGKLPYNLKEAELIGLLCRGHRGEYDSARTDTLRGRTIRTGLLASALRVADAMDIDYRRSDHGKKFREVLAFFFPEELRHWNSADEIWGVRFCCTPDVTLHIFTKGRLVGNLQIEMLRGDVASTPLELRLEEIAVQPVMVGDSSHAAEGHRSRADEHRALVVFPFEPHSIVMTGLSVRHLEASGYTTEILSYADTPDSSKGLWEETLPKLDAGAYDRLIVLGDRPDTGISKRVLQTIRDLRTQNLAISILNRHEANWDRVPALLRLGVEVMLGGDWAYFWGNSVDASAFEWGRVASLCTRDPTQSTVEVTDEEQAAAKGLMMLVYEATARADKEGSADWGELARPILNRIAANDIRHFGQRSDEFSKTYGKPRSPDRIEGKVAIFEQTSGDFASVSYWMMEATIEQYGRAPVRNMQFNVPYVLSTWADDEYVELLAMNHWRDDTAIPIRLLYPDDIGPAPQGNECTVRVRIPRAQSAVVVRALLKACNQSEA